MEELEKLMMQCNNDVIAVIVNRLKTIGELTPTDAIKLSNLAHTEDLNKIMDIISNATEKSKNELSRIVEEASKENDILADEFYKYKNLDTTVRSDVLNAIQSRAIKSMEDDILNLSNTSAFVINGKVQSIKKTYTSMVNQGIYAIQQGLTTYQVAIRGAIKQLADSGLRVVDFESGYSRRLDSQVRMNVLDGVRQMNMEYREQQGKEFGADGVEISVHSLCAKDHQDIQGKQYSIKDFNKLNNSLERPIGTCNCYHSIFPIILGISQPAYTKKELAKIKYESNKLITYTDKLGNEKTTTGYESTQLQRKQETLIRKLKDERNAYVVAGDEQMVAELDKKIKAQTKYYKDMSAEVGLKPKMERARVVKPNKDAIKDAPKVEKFVEEKKKFIDVKDRATAYQSLKDDIGFKDIENNMSKVNEDLLIDSVKQLQVLEDRFNIVSKSINPYISATNDGDAIAYVSHSLFNPMDQNLSLCQKYYKDYASFMATEENSIQSFWSMPCKKENLSIYTVTHEYGHMIQNYLIHQEYIANGWSASNPRQFVDITKKTRKARVKWYEKLENKVQDNCFNEIIDIAKKNNADFKLMDNLSRYGRSNNSEFFAEVFANSQCGEPNELGIAMQEWLKKKGW